MSYSSTKTASSSQRTSRHLAYQGSSSLVPPPVHPCNQALRRWWLAMRKAHLDSKNHLRQQSSENSGSRPSSQEQQLHSSSRSRSPVGKHFPESSPYSVPAKSANKLLETLEKEITCSICLDYFTEPVSIECGHYFCKACIKECWTKSYERYYCPSCRTYSRRSLRPSRELANVVEIAKQMEAAITQHGQKMCEGHQEPLKLFCEQDQALICMICRESREHKTHSVLPIEEAAQDYKKQIEGHVQALKVRRTNLKASKEAGQERCEMDQDRILGEKQAIEAEFGQIYQSVKTMEQVLIIELEELDKDCVQRKDAAVTGLSEEIARLDALISEMEQKCKQPTTELLLDIGNTLNRYENEQQQNPVEISFPTDVGKKLADLSLKNVAVKQILQKYQGMVNFEWEKKRLEDAGLKRVTRSSYDSCRS
ncbi:E3 ubiquitin-protein ligase TRIM41-like isoform X1 [Hemicordylus capensis]|uniref:E3 ubiquitin-protein ligase TRIM41-like isoform X1 n=2 Tax=Hemicordylus capensis TaxID=884348 RepID=UPI0023034FA9|nr:E3 ubiquitin-protein ligase TRIM41-like isoform X1 [Hemicordylus capensis]XP_053155180.1 E3 ubiquitin-protein ligase TRIM41-like isoform X1 [Hemicordylus capensis]